ncbi:hypothetical protein OG985_26200 [Streptomyces sp. NBC_00289]|uniref:hypothetical protein n=1 Tax=Streptomyces sp. NBC_00289 TaxID=2975703 RepID=UPI0032474124
MDTDDSKRAARPDHDWQTRVVEALLDSPTVPDRRARALLIELTGDGLGHRVSLREQPTAPRAGARSPASAVPPASPATPAAPAPLPHLHCFRAERGSGIDDTEHRAGDSGGPAHT